MQMKQILNNKRNEIIKADEKISKKKTTNIINVMSKYYQNTSVQQTQQEQMLLQKDNTYVRMSDINKLTDESEKMLINIGRNLNTTSENMMDVNQGIIMQREGIERVNKISLEAVDEVNQADREISTIEWRNICDSIVLHLVAILLFIAIIIVIIFKIYVISG